MIQTKMNLLSDEREMLEGKHGETMRKIMETLVRFGDAFDAECFVPLDGPSHLVGCYAVPATQPYVELVDKLVAEGIKTKFPFTANPLPLDYANVGCSAKERQVFDGLYAHQDRLEQALAQIGMVNDNSYTCACYMQEVGNTPRHGDNLAWAESSAVVFSNSVLGARTNRNSGIIDLFCAIIGKAPKFGLLTDEGRKADWMIEVATSERPEPFLLGSAIGLKVMEHVPYIAGLDKHIGTVMDHATMDYLKDMGASTASNGAVGLYHVENLTPEAKDLGRSLIRPNAQTYVIDDAELERVAASYPMMWKNPDEQPSMAFVGCPHCSFDQLHRWTEGLESELRRQGKDKLAVKTVLCAAVPVIERFKQTDAYSRLTATGAMLSSLCPLLYIANPLIAQGNIITNSNKLRTYSAARYMDDADLLCAIVKGGAIDEKI